MKQNKHQLEHLPTLLVQQIRLQWYKDCRGGNAAAQRNQYPRAMRLPKDFQRKGDIDEMVQNIDYAPTFLQLAGVEVPEDIQGLSLVPLLKGEKPADWRKALYYHFYEYPAEHSVKRHYGVRTDRYKLIHFYNDINWWELYDLQADPSEMHNLYGQPEYEPVVKELKEEMLKLQEQYNDPVRFSPERDKE